MAVLVTGAAGFIGYHVCKALLDRGNKVIGIDNFNDYYDVILKQSRIKEIKQSTSRGRFQFHRINIADRQMMDAIIAVHKKEIKGIIHLAAQAGVRYSLANPFAYMESNITGHLVVLEICRHLSEMEHLVYASSSSVYGGNIKQPFSVNDRTDTPISLYAATKKADELMSFAYNHLYNIPSTGLRFFTVYGPWGRPDMAYYSFTKALFEGKTIKLFNKGDMKRDFTYINDIVKGVLACFDKRKSNREHKIYNLGNNKPEKLLDIVRILESATGKKAILQMEEMQPGEVKETCADIKESAQDFGFQPATSIEDGLPRFVNWYREYYGM